MSDSFTEVSSQSWFGRIGGAFKGIVFGFFLFIVAFPLLFWNEGRAVRTYKTLKEGAHAVISVAADRVDPGNAGKLVHLTGTATTPEVLADPVFGVSANALKLKRVVEVYQWEETKKTETRKTLGGGTESVTTYSYAQTWSTRPVNSAEFKEPAGHENARTLAYDNFDVAAGSVTLGAFRLSSSLLGQINNFAALPVAANVRLPDALKDQVKPTGTGFYVGKAPQTPAIGDLRIQFMAIAPEVISVVSKQVADSFEPYSAKTGKTVELLETGVHSADEMFRTAQTHNQVLTWILRGVGFLLMLIGLAAIVNPLAVLVDIVPFLGSVVEAGVFFIAFCGAAVLSLLTIAVAWIVYRPLLGVGLIVVAVGVAVLLKNKLKKPAAAAPVLNPGIPPAGPAPRPAPTPAFAPAAGPVLYGIDQRPLPANDQLDTLVPPQCGPFQRVRIHDSESSPDAQRQYADYLKAGDQRPGITIGVFVHANPAEAQRAQKGQCMENPGFAECPHRFDADPSFYRNPDGEGAEFYYTRGRFGFLVQAWNGEKELDAFMAEFPY